MSWKASTVFLCYTHSCNLHSIFVATLRYPPVCLYICSVFLSINFIWLYFLIRNYIFSSTSPVWFVVKKTLQYEQNKCRMYYNTRNAYQHSVYCQTFADIILLHVCMYVCAHYTGLIFTLSLTVHVLLASDKCSCSFGKLFITYKSKKIRTRSCTTGTTRSWQFDTKNVKFYSIRHTVGYA